MKAIRTDNTIILHPTIEFYYYLLNYNGHTEHDRALRYGQSDIVSSGRIAFCVSGHLGLPCVLFPPKFVWYVSRLDIWGCYKSEKQPNYHYPCLSLLSDWRYRLYRGICSGLHWTGHGILEGLRLFRTGSDH